MIQFENSLARMVFVTNAAIKNPYLDNGFLCEENFDGFRLDIPLNNPILYGFCDKLTEQQMESVVSCSETPVGWRADGNTKLIPKIRLYTNYKYSVPQPATFGLTTARESFLSIPASLGIVDLKNTVLIVELKK